MARKRRIPSIDYSIKLIVDRIRTDLLSEIADVAQAVGDVSRRLDEIEQRLGQLEKEERWATVRSELGVTGAPRGRISPERAQRFILDCLQRANGDFIPSRELGGPLGIGRATVAARIQELKADGHNIVSSPRKGYALRE